VKILSYSVGVNPVFETPVYTAEIIVHNREKTISAGLKEDLIKCLSKQDGLDTKEEIRQMLAEIEANKE
jgi:4-hydroxy-3-methylbut-2-enyl diphosphate reductase IspH